MRPSASDSSTSVTGMKYDVSQWWHPLISAAGLGFTFTIDRHANEVDSHAGALYFVVGRRTENTGRVAHCENTVSLVDVRHGKNAMYAHALQTMCEIVRLLATGCSAAPRASWP